MTEDRTTWPTFGRPPQGDADTWTLEGELRQLSPAEPRKAVHHFRAEVAAERAAVVAYLRGFVGLDRIADDIEAGLHRQGGERAE